MKLFTFRNKYLLGLHICMYSLNSERIYLQAIVVCFIDGLVKTQISPFLNIFIVRLSLFKSNAKQTATMSGAKYVNPKKLLED